MVFISQVPRVYLVIAALVATVVALVLMEHLDTVVLVDTLAVAYLDILATMVLRAQEHLDIVDLVVILVTHLFLVLADTVDTVECLAIVA